jgi:hypothetical protein
MVTPVNISEEEIQEWVSDGYSREGAIRVILGERLESHEIWVEYYKELIKERDLLVKER